MPYSANVSESIEFLVNKPVMDEKMSLTEEPSPTCWMFDCWTAKQTVAEKRESYAHKRASRRIGVERQMRVTYDQPHLVEPMRLTVYEDLPSTPLTARGSSQISRMVIQTRQSVSRASTRASLAARRRTLKLSISKPRPTVLAPDCHLRRNPSFRPLQLSIYMSDKRLSDLPEFDALSFTQEGEISVPPRALMRTQSEDLLRPRSAVMPDLIVPKPASMFEQSFSRRMSHVRQKTDSTVISTSRPPSEYDALHSHPVSWYSLPGIPPTMQFATAPNISKTILSPMKEEFTPPPAGAVVIDGKVLTFPDVDAGRVCTEEAHLSLLLPAPGQEDNPAAPSPSIDPGPNRRTIIINQHKSKISQSASIMLASSHNLSNMTRAATVDQAQAAQPSNKSRSYFHTDFKTNNRINQWLDEEKGTSDRSRGSSISTIKTTSSSLSFFEHRRKRSEFYLLNTKPAAEAALVGQKAPSTTKVLRTPTPLTFYKPFPPVKAVRGNTNALNDTSMSRISHSRTQTSSTITSTVATDVLFEQPETPELSSEDHEDFHSARALPPLLAKWRAHDAESMTTVDMKSRTGTLKSTTASSRQPSPPPAAIPGDLVKETSHNSDLVYVEKDKFNFHGSTPSPVTPDSLIPLSAKTQDVGKMLDEISAQRGHRRVNVGIAF